MNGFYFSKQEILDRRRAEISQAHAEGAPVPQAGLSLALLILSSALYAQKQWSGADYSEHPLIVGMNKTRSHTKMIIGILHDVVEDSDWRIGDLRMMGFSERILAGIEGVTKGPHEKYIEFIERCSRNADSIDIKINDLEHNSTTSRNSRLLTPHQIDKLNIYVISYNYLVAVKKNEIKPGSSVRDFLRTRPDLDPGRALWEKFSARPYDDRPDQGGPHSAFPRPPAP